MQLERAAIAARFFYLIKRIVLGWPRVTARMTQSVMEGHVRNNISKRFVSSVLKKYGISKMVSSFSGYIFRGYMTHVKIIG